MNFVWRDLREERNNMEKKLYPLDVGQMLQYLPIRETGTQRCCNISVFSGLQTEIDFNLLKRCIQDEFRRYECLRLRFTAPDEDGNVKQYIAERDDRDVPFLDLSDLTMREADAFLQEKTYEEFNEPEIPMVEITMVKMPEGYNTYIEQGGTNVSGGQRQRLAIARAIARKPEIFIFDDSFSALDFKTDAKLRKELKEYTGGATNIIVAQRIGTVMHADQIIVLDEGKCVGLGKHKDLLKNCEVYKQIAYSQLTKAELGA